MDSKNRLWGIFGLVTSLLIIYLLAKNIKGVEMIIKRQGFLGVIAAWLLYMIFAPTPISTDPLTIVCGAVFGPFFGILISWIGNDLAALEEYYIGRHIGKITNYKEMKHKLPFGLGRLPISSVWFLIFGRLVPGYGGKLISLAAGVYHVPLKRYLWTTALTNFFGSLLLAYGGYHLIHLLKL